MGKSNIKKVLGGLAFVIGVITFPIVMDKWIIGNSIPSNISNSDWVSFLGNYAGGILGGIFTLVALYITIGSERKKHREVLKLSNRGYISVDDIQSTPNLYGYESNITKKL